MRRRSYVAAMGRCVEELVRQFEPRIAIAAIRASAIACMLLGDATDFSVAKLSHDGAATRRLLGALAGLLAVAYNRAGRGGAGGRWSPDDRGNGGVSPARRQGPIRPPLR
jgi:hypothetical protein